jgi:hypothetical protein
MMECICNLGTPQILLYLGSVYSHHHQVGVERGADWQAALQAASEVGCQQVLLSDRPIRVTERRFGDALLLSAGEGRR